MRKFFDFCGMTLSILCVIHCIAMPILLFLVPTFAVTYLGEDEWFHQIALVVIAIAAILAFVPGFKLHKKLSPILWFAGGIFFLLFSAFFAHDLIGHEYEPIVAIMGSILLVRAHYMNHKLCNHCHDHKHLGWSNQTKTI